MVQVYSGLNALPAEYMQLFHEGGRESFFLSDVWFQHFAKTALDTDQAVRIYGVTEENGEPAAMFVARAPVRGKGAASLRTLSGLANYYSCFFATHLSRSARHIPDILSALAHTIAQESPRWDAVEIRPLDVDSYGFSVLKESLKAAGFFVQPFFCFGNWYLPVEGRTYAQFIETLPSILKNTLSRKRKKLEKSGRAHIEIVTGGSGLDAAIQAYTNIYLASWKQPEPYPDFIPGLIRTCANLGVLRLGMIHIDGEPAAAQIWIVQNGRALIYKLAYDERFSDLSVGTILTATLMQHVLDMDKVSEVDYLSGDDAYKKDWMSHRRERWGLLALNPRTVRGALSVCRHFGGRAIKRFTEMLSRGPRPAVNKRVPPPTGSAITS